MVEFCAKRVVFPAHGHAQLMSTRVPGSTHLPKSLYSSFTPDLHHISHGALDNNTGASLNSFSDIVL